MRAIKAVAQLPDLVLSVVQIVVVEVRLGNSVPIRPETLEFARLVQPLEIERRQSVIRKPDAGVVNSIQGKFQQVRIVIHAAVTRQTDVEEQVVRVARGIQKVRVIVRCKRVALGATHSVGPCPVGPGGAEVLQDAQLQFMGADAAVERTGHRQLRIHGVGEERQPAGGVKVDLRGFVLDEVGEAANDLGDVFAQDRAGRHERAARPVGVGGKIEFEYEIVKRLLPNDCEQQVVVRI